MMNKYDNFKKPMNFDECHLVIKINSRLIIEIKIIFCIVVRDIFYHCSE